MKDLTTVKQGKATTVQDRSGKCFTEEREILNRWTEYCGELYNRKAHGDQSVLSCPQKDTEDDNPILRKEVEAAVQSMKKGKSAAALPDLPNDQPHQPPKQNHAEDHTEQIETTSGEDHR